MAIEDQVNEIITTLGTDPEGVYSNVRVRLDILEARINNPNVPSPTTTNPFYIDGYGGVSISVGDGYPTESRIDGSMYLRRDGTVSEGLYLRRGGNWELQSGGGISVHNNLSGIQGGTSSEYYHLTSTEHTWLIDGPTTTGYWSETKGGTGQSTYTTGDILYSDSSNSLTKLSVGTDGYVLTLSAGIPSWQAATGGGSSTISTTINTGKIGLLTPNTDGYLLTNLAEINTEDVVTFIAPYDGELSQLRVRAGTAPGGSETVIFTARIEGVDSSLTATLSGSNQTAEDVLNTPSITAGQYVTLRFVSSVLSVAADISVFFLYTQT